MERSLRGAQFDGPIEHGESVRQFAARGEGVGPGGHCRRVAVLELQRTVRRLQGKFVVPGLELHYAEKHQRVGEIASVGAPPLEVGEQDLPRFVQILLDVLVRSPGQPQVSALHYPSGLVKPPKFPVAK